MPARDDFIAKQCKRYDQLMQRRVNFDTLWEEIADFMVPRKRDILTRYAPGRKQTIRIYDGTVMGVIDVAVSAIDGTMTPSTIRWFSLRIEEQGFDDINDALSIISDLMFNALNDSNFKAEMQEVYEDLLVFGTSCLWVDEGEPDDSGRFGGLRFRAVPPGHYVIAENAYGFVDTVFECFELTLDAASRQFGVENLSEGAQTKHRNGKFDDKLSFFRQVCPIEQFTMDERSMLNLDDERPYASLVIERGMSSEGMTVDASTSGAKALVDTGAFDSFPYIVSRWRKTSGEDYGRSPGMNALPDVRTLNEAVKMRLQQWQLAIRPPIGVPNRGVLGQVNLTPGAINTFQGSPRESFTEMVTGARFDVASFQEEQLRAAIRNRFYVDQIQFPPMEGTPVTATEFAGRFEVMQRILGPILGRMEYELLSFTIRRVFNIMSMQRALPLFDPQILEATQIVFEGPLARTQRASDIEAVTRAVSVLVGVAELKPEVMDALDWDAIAKFIPARSGVPAHLIRNQEDIDAIHQARQQAQEQMAEQQRMEQMSASIKNIAPLAQTVSDIGQREPVPAGV